MKILHICLGAFYIDNYSYQENLLPKYHKKLGYDVSILASLQTFDKNGKPDFLTEESEYINEYGINVKRIRYKKLIKPIARKLKIYSNVYKNIESFNPDIIFIHGCQFFNMNEIKKYVINHPKTKIYIDNHCDFSNSATNWVSKNILHKIFWRHAAKLIEPFTEKFYGVLPVRVDFLKDIYKIHSDKVELLVMGADDEEVEKAIQVTEKQEVRRKYGVDNSDFLIVTGGKIDQYKKQIISLMRVINKIADRNIKLIVFGSIVEELQEEVKELCNDETIKYIGWLNNQESYKLFATANLVVFPGRHSVYWEQAAGVGTPLIIKYWEGTTHVDKGGNCEYLHEDSEEEIEKTILNIIRDNEKYSSMVHIAQTKAMNEFSYLQIARKSIGNIN